MDNGEDTLPSCKKQENGKGPLNQLAVEVLSALPLRRGNGGKLLFIVEVLIDNVA